MTPEEAFFTLHKDLPREGPGDRESLDWALDLAGVARDARILDAGSGPGADIEGLLAHAPEGHVTAIDLHQGFIDAVRARYPGDARVTAICGDMAKPGGPYELIWCASALYAIGVTEGLRGWLAALAPGGKVAFSEPVQLVETPAPEVTEFWQEYPALTDADGVRARIEAAGYRLLGHRLLSTNAWAEYYDPQAARIAKLRPGADAALTTVLDEAEQEITVWRRFPDQVGYAMFLAEPA